MGAYHLADEGWHGYPSYATNVEGERKSYLYRAGGGDHEGKWCVTDDKDNIAQNVGAIRSASAAELPTQEGLRWEVDYDIDDAIACIDCRATTDRLKGMASSTKSNDQVSKVSARRIPRFDTHSRPHHTHTHKLSPVTP